MEAARPSRRPVGSRRYVDKTYVRVGGVWRYVHRAVDQYGHVIDVYVLGQKGHRHGPGISTAHWRPPARRRVRRTRRGLVTRIARCARRRETSRACAGGTSPPPPPCRALAGRRGKARRSHLMHVSDQKSTTTAWRRGHGQACEHGVLPRRPGRDGGLGSCASTSIAVWGQERGQRRQHLLGSLLGDPVAAAGDHQTLHVVRGEPHRVRDPLTLACRPADRQHGQGQPPGLAPLVLRDGGVERAVPPEAAAQGFRVAGEGADVVPDGVVGQFSSRPWWRTASRNRCVPVP
jgi:DDE domain